MQKEFYLASSTLIGTAIGAGILGIPFVVMKAGFSLGLATLLIIASIIILVTLYLGEIGLRTKTNHHLPGYAQKYLGKKGKRIMFLAFAFGVYASLTAYLIGEGDSLSFLFLGNTSYSLHFGIAFWLLLSAVSYFGLKALEDGETLGIAAIILLTILILITQWNNISIENLTYTNHALFYAPFGVILFAFLGFASIPEVERILKNHKHLTKKTIISSYLIILSIYIIFTAIVVGSMGSSTPALATLALGKSFILLGMLTIFTSYFAISIALIDSLRFDFNKTRKAAWLSTIFPPLIIFILLNLFEKAIFTKVIAVGGVVSGGLIAILILQIVQKAKAQGKRRPEYSIPYSKILGWAITLIFITGAILEIFFPI